MLQDRLVKELRLRSISFAKAPRQEFNFHRELDVDDDLDMVFNWREARRMSKSLTVQYDKVLYLIEDSELSRRAIGKYIDVWHYPSGHKELRLNGISLPYSTPPMTSFLKSIRVILWTTNVWDEHWKWTVTS